MFKIGERVISDEGIGIVEEIDGDEKAMGVRWLTPNNVPSIVMSWVDPNNFTHCAENIVPIKRSAEWQKQSDAFYDQIRECLYQEGFINR
jgi:hypothetical protein